MIAIWMRFAPETRFELLWGMKASAWLLLPPGQVSRGSWRIAPHRPLTHTLASVGGNWGKPTKVPGELQQRAPPCSCRQMCAGAGGGGGGGLESSERGHAAIRDVDQIKAGLDEAQPGLISDSCPLKETPQTPPRSEGRVPATRRRCVKLKEKCFS